MRGYLRLDHLLDGCRFDFLSILDGILDSWINFLRLLAVPSLQLRGCADFSEEYLLMPDSGNFNSVAETAPPFERGFVIVVGFRGDPVGLGPRGGVGSTP